MVTLTTTQAAFLAATAPHAWDIPRVIADPDHHRDYTDTTTPWQALEVDGHRWQVTITERALTYTDHRDATSHRSPVTIRWSALREHARTLTATQRQPLVDALAESRTANTEFPAPTPPAWTLGCGRVHGEGPLTAAQQTYTDYMTEFHTTRRVPAHQRITTAHDQVATALTTALTSGDEPRDLLDLLMP